MTALSSATATEMINRLVIARSCPTERERGAGDRVPSAGTFLRTVPEVAVGIALAELPLEGAEPIFLLAAQGLAVLLP